MTDIRTKLPFVTKAAFGIGSVGEIVFYGMVNTFIAIFYNQALGLSNSLIGLAIMLAMLGDAVSDPVVGMISDRWRSRLGRRHPFLFAAPIPVGISLYLIFSPPEFITQAANGEGINSLLTFGWLAFWTIVSRIFLTLYVIPHLALGGELTKDPNDRSKLFSMNAIFGYVSGALFAFTAWGFFLGGESVLADGTTVPKHLDAASYPPLVLTACALVLGTILLSAWGTKSRIPFLSAPPPSQARMSFVQFYKDLIGAFANRNYAFLIIGFFFFMLSVGLNETYSVFVNTYFWELETREIRWFGLAIAPAVMVGALLAPHIMKVVDRKPALIGALIGIAIFVQLPIDLRLLGLMPENGDPALLPLLLASSAAVMFCLAIGAVAVLSMLGDVADQNDLTHGLRQEGLIYSARAFFAKASNSAGHLIAGVVLDVFVVLPFEAVPGQVDEDVVFRMGLAAGPLMSVGALIAIPIYARYRLTRSEHAEILDALGARDEKEAGDAPVAAPAE